MYQGKYFPIKDFSGGYCGNLPADQLGLNQAADLDNIILHVDGKGWRTRGATGKYNSSALNGNTTGLYFWIKGDATQHLIAVSGTKLYDSTYATPTFTDITGSLTIHDSRQNSWTMFTFNDNVIGFGGPATNPDAPFKWTGSGNASALGGTPPAAYGAFTANNRVFAFNTQANPSTIYWTVLASAEDWSGAGSGSTVVGSVSDNQKVVAAAILSANTVLLFKNNSIYQMNITTAPFPIYPLFSNVGTLCKDSVVVVNGVAYFLTSDRQMKSTDGNSIQDYPSSAEDLLINNGALSDVTLIRGFRQQGIDFDWIVWSGITQNGSEPSLALIWDLKHKCWLKCSTGYQGLLSYVKAGGPAASTNTRFFGGTYDGFVVSLENTGQYADYFGGSTAAVAAYWRSGWLTPSNFDEITQIKKFIAQYRIQTSGSITVNYGFDFISDSKSFTLSQAQVSSELITSKEAFLSGRGNAFQFKIGLSSSSIGMELDSILLGGKSSGQKRISAT